MAPITERENLKQQHSGEELKRLKTLRTGRNPELVLLQENNQIHWWRNKNLSQTTEHNN
jgi:hypothetical protein